MAVPPLSRSNSFTFRNNETTKTDDDESPTELTKSASDVSLRELMGYPKPAANPYLSFRTKYRTASASSMTFLPPCPITLVDHIANPSDQSAGLFARGVTVNDYTVVSGNIKAAGAYVVWNCILETLEGNKIILRKRYSEFDALRTKLVQAFPRSAAALPALPRKSVVSKFRPKFLEQRRQGLNYFLACVFMNPEFSGSPLVKQFIFQRD